MKTLQNNITNNSKPKLPKEREGKNDPSENPYNRLLVLNNFLTLLVMPAGTQRPSEGTKQNAVIDNLAKLINNFLAF